MMNRPVLVPYATYSDATMGVAEAIASTFAEKGTPVEVRPMTEITDVTPYRAVVAGSAIQKQKWLPEAMQFIKKHQQELSRRPFASFLVCITLSMKGSEQYREGVSSWMAPVRALVHPVSEGLFAGTLDFHKMPLNMNTLLMRLPVLMHIWQEGDHRDWAAIRNWAEQTHPLLLRSL